MTCEKETSSQTITQVETNQEFNQTSDYLKVKPKVLLILHRETVSAQLQFVWQVKQVKLEAENRCLMTGLRKT